MFCIQCGSYNPDHAQFCGTCGYRDSEARNTSGLIPGPAMPIAGGQPGSVPLAQATPQIGQVPYVPGTPSPYTPGSVPFEQHLHAAPGSSSPLAPREAMRLPQTGPHHYPPHPTGPIQGHPVHHPPQPGHPTGPIHGHPTHHPVHHPPQPGHPTGPIQGHPVHHAPQPGHPTGPIQGHPIHHPPQPGYPTGPIHGHPPHPSHPLQPTGPFEGHPSHPGHFQHTGPFAPPHSPNAQYSQPLQQVGQRTYDPSGHLKPSMSRKVASTGAKTAGNLSRRALFWLIAGGTVAVATTGGAAVVIHNLVTSTPEKTISAFMDALKNRDGQGAYDQLSTHLQSTTNEQQYINTIRTWGGAVSSYSINNVQVNGNNATADVSVTALFFLTATYSVTLVNENGTWKIDGGTLLSIY